MMLHWLLKPQHAVRPYLETSFDVICEKVMLVSVQQRPGAPGGFRVAFICTTVAVLNLGFNSRRVNVVCNWILTETNLKMFS